MIPEPLHPAVVHLPLALAALLPLLTLLGAVAVARAWLPRRSWAAILLLHALLLGSAWAAHETGEREEERAERVVAEEHIEEHEERADVLLATAALAAAISAAGLLGGQAGALARAACVLVSLAVMGAAIRVGHSGGELVYHHGAASAYQEEPPARGR